MRDITLGDTIYPKFTTRAFATGIPTTLAGTPVLSVYEENNLTQITAGVSVSADYDSVTGLNQATIVATSGNGYEAGKSYDLVITTGTVGGVSVVGEVVSSFTVEQVPKVNVSQVSGDATAADNLELMYDGTGYTDDTAPASRAQIGLLAVGSGGIATNAESFTKAGAEPETNTFASTTQLDGTFHIVEDDATSTDAYYEFNVGTDGVPIEVSWSGYAQSNGDSYALYFYNWGGTSWDQVGSLDASNSTTVINDTYRATIAHVGTGANAGLVRFRFLSTDGTAYATDRIICVYTQISQGIANGSTITLGSSTTNENFDGHNWNLALGGQVISGSHFAGPISVTGTGTSANGSPYSIEHAKGINATLTSEGFIADSGILALAFTSSGGVTADEIILRNIYSQVAGTGAPTYDWSAVTKETSVNVRGLHGGGTWTFTADCTASIEVYEGGKHDITTGGGDVELRGHPREIELTTTGTSTTQIVAETGPITIDGTGGTVNIWGYHGAITDTSSGTTVNDFGITTTEVGDILADTNELQTDWTNGGRLDLLLDAIPTTAMRGTDNAATEAKQDIIDTNVDTIITEVGTAGAGLTDLGGMSTGMKAEVLAEVVKVLVTQMTESYAADGTAPTLAQAIMLIQQTIGDFAIAGTTITTKKLDGSTTAATYTLDDGTNPTSRTRTT